MRKSFWALPAVDLHNTQVLQGLIASRKLPLQPCAVQARMSHWLAMAICSRSEQSTSNDATFPKMDTHRQSSRAIPLSHERGGRRVGGTCLESLSARERPLHCTLYNQFSLEGQLNGGKLPGHFQGLIASRNLPLKPCAVQACPRVSRAMCRRWTPIGNRPEQSQSETWWPNSRQHQFGEPVCSA